MLKNKLQGVEDSLPTVASACAACLTADSPSHDINAVKSESWALDLIVQIYAQRFGFEPPW
jgi:hypothetical protein